MTTVHLGVIYLVGLVLMRRGYVKHGSDRQHLLDDHVHFETRFELSGVGVLLAVTGWLLMASALVLHFGWIVRT